MSAPPGSEVRAEEGDVPPTAEETQRFDRLLAQLRVVFGPDFRHAGQPGFVEADASLALRAIIGISTAAAVWANPGLAHHGGWLAALWTRRIGSHGTPPNLGTS
jgi:hypothetical protein